jgi:adenylate cyclase class 2
VKHGYRARFHDADIPAIRSALRESAAELAFPRTLHKRATFGNELIRGSRSWLRLYTTENHAVLTLTCEEGNAPSTSDITALETAVSDFDACRELLEAIGLTVVRYQENYREEWELDDVACDLDEWPRLPPFVEIAGPGPAAVRAAAARLGLDGAATSFGSVDELYKERLGRDILGERFLVFGDDPA